MEYDKQFPSSADKKRAFGYYLSYLFNPRSIPGISYLEKITHAFSPAERLALYALGTLLVLSTVWLLFLVNDSALSFKPARGGTLVEGIIGTPRFINPVIASSNADRDATALVFSGLMRADNESGFVLDLAESFEITDDGKVYTFVLREDVYFHDNTRVTAEDVVFTVQTAQDPMIKSPRRVDWEGVLAAVIDEKTVQFTLPRPYAPFLENASIGILPKHLWQSVSPEEFQFHPLNTQPVGSGPFKLGRSERTRNGALDSFVLESFDGYSLGRPYINRIILKFFANEDALILALERGDIDSAAGITPGRAENIKSKGISIHTAPLPRVFAAFFNQNQNTSLARQEVRAALIAAIDNKLIIDEVLLGYADVLGGPIPPGILESDSSQTSKAKGVKIARELLEKGGWKWIDEKGVWARGGENLSVQITTVNTPELIQTAELVADMWRDAGIASEVQIFSPGELTVNIIRPRNYEALLFGEIVGRSLDLFAFWHSSQRNDPGLNLSLYTNSAADKLLGEARAEVDKSLRESKYSAFADLVIEDQPAAFLYSPRFIYLTPSKLEGISLGSLSTPSERFSNVHDWFLESEKVWHIFTK